MSVAEVQQFRADSAERLARLRRTDTLKGIFLSRYLELFEEVQGRALVTRALGALGETSVHDYLNYPYAGMVRVGIEVADELAAHFGGVEPWLRAMGRLATTCYLDSLLGRAFLATFQPSPRTMLTGMPWAIGTCFSFGKRQVSFVGAHEAHFRCRSDFTPAPSVVGGVLAAAEATGARGISVTVDQLDLFNYDLDVRWS